MSYQHTANHLAAQGRNGDSTLMHVSPNEVAGLQALAQQHGRSITINPQTGLPEAFSLSDLLPAAAGFALDAFLPGAGEAAAGLFGATGAGAAAMGTAGIVGGLAGLSSGSLEKGIMAGLGAYGGANLSQGLGAAGSAANANAANAAFDSSNPAMDAARVAAKPDIGAGLSEAAAHPMDFLKNNKWGVAAAALPALMDTTGQGGIPGSVTHPGYIRKYAKNPVTGALEQVSATPVDQFGSQSAVTFGGVGNPVKYDEGGVVGEKIKPDPFGGGYLVYNETTQKYDHVDANGVTTPAAGLNSASAPAVKFAAPPTHAPVMRDPNDTRTDSQKAYDYLMGVPGAKNPMLFYHDQGTGTAGPADAKVPLDLNTRTGGRYVINKETGSYDWVPNADAGLAALAGQQGGGRNTPSVGMSGQGFTGSTTDGSPSTGIASAANSAAATLGNLGLTSLSNALASQVSPNYSHEGLNAPIGGDPNQGNEGMHSSDAPATSARGEGVGRDSQAGSAAAAGTVGGYGPGTPGFGGRDAGGDTSGGVGRGEGGADSGGAHGAGGPGDAQGGFFHKGKFNFHPAQMYAQGGIMALANGGLGSLGGYADGGYAPPAPIENLGSIHPEDLQAKYDLATQHANVPLQNKLKNEMDLRNRLRNPQIYAGGGGIHQANLGGYSDGGQLLRGPGDGVSDSIPATIGKGQPARLADGEFVVPARIVSELGNGSTEAGAKQLYAMLARIQAGRAKTTGKNQVAKNSNAARHLPA